jgi:hypothetical protein
MKGQVSIAAGIRQGINECFDFKSVYIWMGWVREGIYGSVWGETSVWHLWVGIGQDSGGKGA